MRFGPRSPASGKWLCAVASLPVPGVFLSETDQSTDHGPEPGSGTIVCRRVSELVSITGGRYIEKTLKVLVDLLSGELP